MITILIVFAYLFVAGVIGQIVWATRFQRCEKCRDENWNCYDMHEPGAIICGLFWPLATPVVVGRIMVWFVMSKDSRAERKAKREKVRHEQRLVELRAEKARDDAVIEFLERNGVNARIDLTGTVS